MGGCWEGVTCLARLGCWVLTPGNSFELPHIKQFVAAPSWFTKVQKQQLHGRPAETESLAVPVAFDSWPSDAACKEAAAAPVLAVLVVACKSAVLPLA